ncbi:MAG: ABC transporter ATP-binding protein [Candidatus Eremiobacteraeota bacterium]|nr:ABC transporter ATP-binding protein [Candidatus Eremiobacteraeota bacterium]
MLSVRNAVVRFGGLTAIDALDLDIPERGVFLLVGPNGAGKTTLINVLSRVTPLTEGTVTFAGVDLLRLRPHEVIGRGIARSFQKAELFGSLTVLENVMVGLNASEAAGIDAAFMPPWVRAQERRTRERGLALLERLDLLHVCDARPSGLPYGYQKLLDVARALVSEPKLLLLDEPFAGITSDEAPRLIACIVEAAKDRAVLMVEHHLELVLDIAERVTVMNFGAKIAEGSPGDVREDPEVIRCYLGTGRHKAEGIVAC